MPAKILCRKNKMNKNDGFDAPALGLREKVSVGEAMISNERK